MTAKPSRRLLTDALTAAWRAHHDYEVNFLAGVRDEHWPGWYAAYVLGRLGDFETPTRLAQWLEEAPSGDDWSADAAAHVLARLDDS